MSKLVTTAMGCISSTDALLTGEERWPILGFAISAEEYAEIMQNLTGMKRHWDCLDKARKVVEIIKRGHVVVGSCMVWSGDMKSQYGYYFNPPLEFHAWVIDDKRQIIDVALPGVIEKGLTTSDEYGPMLIGNESFVLAGYPIISVEYKIHQYLT